MVTYNPLDPAEKVFASRVEDAIQKVRETSMPRLTDFLDPHQQGLAESILASQDDLNYLSYGGYSSAERVRLAIMPRHWLGESVDLEIDCLEVRLEGDPPRELAHRDYLGAILNLGLKREKIGDIIIGEKGAKILAEKGIALLVMQELRQVNQAAVSVSRVGPGEIQVMPEKVKEIKGTVASLRLDAVASLGFGASRSKVARFIKADQVKLNWQRANDPSAQVKEGDVITLRRKGRIILEEVRGESRKGRTQVLIKKML